MKKALLSLLMTIPMTLTHAAPVYIWDNQQGLVKGQNCEISDNAETTFRISGYTGRKAELIEKFRDKHHIHQTHLVVGSFLNLEGGQNKKGYPHVRVVGRNKHLKVKANRYFTKRNDKGYIHPSSILPINDAIFELKDGTPVGGSLELYAKFLIPMTNGGSLNSVKCDNTSDKTTVLFGLYSRDDVPTAEAFIGISPDDTSVLRSIRKISKEKAEELIPALTANSGLDSLEAIREAANNLAEEVEEEIQSDQEAQVEQVEQQEEAKEAEVLQVAEDLTEKSIEQVTDTTERIVCVREGSLANVRDENLDRKFKVGLDTKVKKYVGFSSEPKEKVIGGKTYKFVEVMFPEHESSSKESGWIAESIIKAPSDCEASVLKKKRLERGELLITSLNSKDCCEFPVRGKPRANYYSQRHQSNFAWRRGGGKRAHAGVDLYRYVGEKVYAVADGKVIRFAYFYDGTYQVTVKHNAGFIVRYGEVMHSGAKKKGATVKIGTPVGKIGKLESCCSPMLHFELYKGNRTGSLTNRHNRNYPYVLNKWKNKKFQRRSDLLDPTPFLRKWQQKSLFDVNF